MDGKKGRQAMTKGGPVEKPKKLPADFPEKFDIERDQTDDSDDQKQGGGARLHGSM
jgi:hypothetical protein